MTAIQSLSSAADGIANRAGYFPVLGMAVGTARAVSSLVLGAGTLTAAAIASIGLGVIGTGSYIFTGSASPFFPAIETVWTKSATVLHTAGCGLLRGLVEVIGGIPLFGQIMALNFREHNLIRKQDPLDIRELSFSFAAFDKKPNQPQTQG